MAATNQHLPTLLKKTTIIVDAQVMKGSVSNKKYHTGIVLSVMAAFCFASERIIIKYAISNGVNAIVGGLWTHGIKLIFCLVVAQLRGESWFVPRKEVVHLVGYSISGVSGSLLLFVSLSYLPPLDVTVLLQTQPIFVIFITNFLNKKLPKWYDLMICLFMIVGIVLIAKPEFVFGYKDKILATDQVIGTLLIISSSTLFAMSTIFTDKMSETSVVGISTIGAATRSGFFFVMISFLDVEIVPDFKMLRIIFISGIFVSVGSFMSTFAIKIEDAINVSLAATLGVLFSFILQLLIFAEYPDYYVYTGSILMMVGVNGIIMKKKYANINL